MPNILGIRHHGPGSAKSLMQAFAQQPPDVILIECPADVEPMLAYASHAELEPPVAILVYHPKDLKLASFFPFAVFSPEWQAIQFAQKHGIPLRFMDLPMSMAFALEDEQAAPHKRSHDDPFTAMAQLAGYSDPERWWEAYFERSGHHDAAEVFAVVQELMTALRAEKTQPESRETLLREAYMRQCIRQAQKDGFQHIAVVCGAWHGPVLADLKNPKASDDAALLKGLKKIKTECTWIPWAYNRLSNQSGYGAGVSAPYWYGILFREGAKANSENPTSPSVAWLSEAARLLRSRDVDTSSAHVLEAARLADALAALRKTTLPGITELREAAVAILGEGRDGHLELIENELITGNVMGRVPHILPVPPLKADFEANVKSCRLECSSSEKKLSLDLRENADLKKSILLHRCILLDIPWGKTIEISGSKQGRFHENWQICWLPEYEIRLIEAGNLGNTVASAATMLLFQKISEAQGLPQLSSYLEQVMKAELGPLMPQIIQKISLIGIQSSDAVLLAETVVPLANAYRYGQARQTDTALIFNLLEKIIPRLCLQLPSACTHINSDLAAEIMQKSLAVNRAMGILNQPDFNAAWQRCLAEISAQPDTTPLLSGMAARLLFDKQLLHTTQTVTLMQFELSKAQHPLYAAEWLEGFLHGSGLLLLHQPELWGLLDRWVAAVEPDAFREVLPLLRRTFSRFHGAERGKMLDLAKNKTYPNTITPSGEDMDLENPLLQPVKALLRVIFEENADRR